MFESILNLADVFAELWPLDDSPRILMRVLLHYNLAANFKANESEKAKFMTEFCDAVLRENACRAVEHDPPLSFREAKERWTELSERANLATVAAQPASQGGTSGGGQQMNSGRDRQAGRRDGITDGAGKPAQGQKTNMAMRSRTCRHQVGGQSWPVCFQFNRGGCKRTTKGAGCDDGRGGMFSHVCNFWDNQANKYCLQPHPRDKNH